MSSASAGVERHPQLSVGEHVRAIGQRDRALRPLLDEQDRDAAVADLAERGEDRIDHRRRETERRLVEQEHVRGGDERAADRELLLLTARERSRLAAAEVGEHRKEVVGDGQRLRAVRPPGRESQTEVLLHGQLAEDTSALGDERDPGARDRLG